MLDRVIVVVAFPTFLTQNFGRERLAAWLLVWGMK